MNTNCLLTKLKSVVNNDNLEHLGAMDINVSQDSSFSERRSSIIFNCDEPCKIITKDGYIATTFAGLNDTSTRVTEYTLPVGRQTVLYFSNGDYKIQINNKYHLTEISLPNTSETDTVTKTCKLNSLEYSTNIHTIGTRGMLYGDLSALSKLTSLTRLVFTLNTQLTGSIESLIPLSSLSYLNLYGCKNVTGDALIFTDRTKFTSLQFLDLSGCNITHKDAATKALIEEAHPGITVNL